VFRIPRPGRQAARDIFRKHLVPDLPYWGVNGEGAEPVRDALVEQALASIYAPNGEAATLGTLVLRDGSRRTVTAPEVMSGALIAQVVADAKRRSALRTIRGQASGLTTCDLLEALDRQVAGITQRLKPGPALRQMLDLPSDLDVVSVDVDARRRGPGSHLYLALHDR
ncbi:MAG: hypothetical protein HY510_03010, partial [Acidobacteria bacterium]|nr:hypothetical protein [Acidobacteriota bacterium]